jgi:tRNA dimethylallyltransferase
VFLDALAIIGPTAAGKSAVALQLAKALDGEIVSCDSIQVYRGFSVGCAKPSLQEQQRVRHHLIDVVDSDAAFDAEQFRALARAAILDIQRRGKLAIICGGTGLYFRLLRFGLIDAPKADWQLREQLYAQDPQTLYAELSRVDPVSAATIKPNNLVHVVRALEIYKLSGKPASLLRDAHAFAKEEVPMRVVLLDRNDLKVRVIQRAEAMLRSGLLQECEQLLKQGVSPQAKPMLSVGYKEACEVVLNIAPLTDVAERIAKSTWQYARRQRTWFRRERRVTPFVMHDKIADEILNWWQTKTF